jgi:hypothetical protein
MNAKPAIQRYDRRSPPLSVRTGMHFFQAFQQSLKKSLSINRLIEMQTSKMNNPDFHSQCNTPFAKEVKDTVYVDREDTTIALR